LASGSRAVYLAVGVGALLLLARHVLRREWRALRGTALATICTLAVVGAMELIGGFTVIAPAWQAKGTMEQTTAAVEKYGVLTQRLRLWKQGLLTAIEYPLG